VGLALAFGRVRGLAGERPEKSLGELYVMKVRGHEKRSLNSMLLEQKSVIIGNC
jgi:hypothetical protein